MAILVEPIEYAAQIRAVPPPLICAAEAEALVSAIDYAQHHGSGRLVAVTSRFVRPLFCQVSLDAVKTDHHCLSLLAHS